MSEHHAGPEQNEPCQLIVTRFIHGWPSTAELIIIANGAVRDCRVPAPNAGRPSGDPLIGPRLLVPCQAPAAFLVDTSRPLRQTKPAAGGRLIDEDERQGPARANKPRQRAARGFRIDGELKRQETAGLDAELARRSGEARHGTAERGGRASTGPCAMVGNVGKTRQPAARRCMERAFPRNGLTATGGGRTASWRGGVSEGSETNRPRSLAAKDLRRTVRFRGSQGNEPGVGVAGAWVLRRDQRDGHVCY